MFARQPTDVICGDGAAITEGLVIGLGEPIEIEQGVDVTTIYNPRPVVPASSLGTQEVLVREYERGTLLIDVLTAHGERLVWRGSTQTRIHEGGTPEERDARARAAAAAVLEHFPPPSR